MSAAPAALSAARDTQRNSLLLTHVAFTAILPKRHSDSSKGRKPLPKTRTTVEPVISPLLGLNRTTDSGVWYAKRTALRLYCCPLRVTSTLRSAASCCSGDVHVRLPSPASTARTMLSPNLHR